jgi:iron complex outermembrane receptor protein
MCRRAGIVLLAIFTSILTFHALPSVSLATSPNGTAIKSHFDLPAEPLDKALRDLAVQANCNISYEPSIVAGLSAPAVSGDFTLQDALSLLLKGTSLHALYVNADTLQIVEGDASTANVQHHVDKDIEEIIVTGTHIRGTKDSPLPVQVFTRADIDATGTFTVQQFLQTLPQNVGDVSENTVGGFTAKSRTANTVNGSAPNLRGIGAEATLVLINGHRVAPGNSDGSFVDISMIPLAAVERIEMVTDGASAIYGSDAVGGVVNIILRSKFDGAESRALFGAVGTGSMHDVQASQTVGDAWSTGSAVLSYQYSDQTPLSAGSRDYLQSVLLPFNLIPEQVQHAAFANIEQEIKPGFDLHGDLMYSHRATAFVFSENDGSYGNYFDRDPSQIDSYSASLGSTVKLPRQNEIAISATYSESDTSQQFFEAPPANQPLIDSLKTKSAVVSLDANLDGVLATIPTGPVHYAVGAQYRRESFGNTYLFPPADNTFYPRRNVAAGYLELRSPVVGPVSGSRGDPALELTAADRVEHYSDFGSTNNPQIGAIWKPVSGVAVRGTYGTSFKAPTLSDLNPIPSQVVPFPGLSFNPVPGGAPNPNILIVNGGNPDLKPEKATVWTLGLDFKPLDIAGFTAKLTYYDIVFRDEITTFDSTISTTDAFVDEAILGPEIVQRNPLSSTVQQWASFPSFTNPLGVDLASIGAILDGRYLNLSTVKTRGLDFGLDYKATLSGSLIDTGIDGTRIFAFENQFTNSAPITSFLSTPYNPIDLKLRGRVVVTRGPLSVGLYLNFTNSYQDTNIVPSGHVSSWTTADAVVSYEFGSEVGPFSGASIALSVVNFTDRDPPYVTNYSGLPMNYDGVNANALGRFFSLRLQKHW